MRQSFIAIFIFALVLIHPAFAQDNAVQELKNQIESLKQDYEKRILELEQKVQQLETQMLQVPEAEVAPQVVETPQQTAPGILNPAISVIGNFVGRADDQEVFNEEGDRIDDKLNVRETEIDFRVPVDPYADGVLIVAFESEFPGEFEAGVEEGFVNIKKLPFWDQNPLGLKLKVGRFRPAFGKTNILHTHDLPTTFRPMPVEEFLGEEGFVQNGLSGTFFIPTPWDSAASLDATVEIMDGGNIAVSPQTESRLSYLGHLRYFRTFEGGHDMEVGWSSYFHPSGNGVGAATAHGADFLYRWKPFRQGQWRSYLLGAELIFAPNLTADEEEEIVVDDTPLGFTAFTQWQFDRRTYAGIRYDQTDVLLSPDLQRRSITPYLSYYFSEFLRFRVNFEHRWSDLEEEDGRNSLVLELNWVFGSHPPEPYWVNK
ncbi:hypothetical protein L0222_09870 [bacterium]|nr:hypothetical protein [bacterium]MCI0604523.1 hypothetical protein [bacterium]